MVRHYRKKPKCVAGRRIRAAQMREEGLSLRQTAAVLEVSHTTVANDLRAWDAEQAALAKVSTLPVKRSVKKMPQANDKSALESSANVIPLRRRDDHVRRAR